MADDVLPAGDGEGGRRRARLSGRRIMTAMVALVAVGGFSAIVWYAFERGKEVGGNRVAPIIKADGGPTRIRPLKPGGMKIPNQDKEIYLRLAPAAGRPKVERLLPPPPAPLKAPTRPPPPPRRDSGSAPPEPSPPPKSPVAKPRTALLTPPKPSEAAPPPRREPVGARVPAKTGSASMSQRPNPARKTAGRARLRVQLASHRSDASARRAWVLLKRAHANLLGTLDPIVKRVDLGAGKGVYYRLQAGPLTSEAEARALCAKLKQRKQGCLVVRP